MSRHRRRRRRRDDEISRLRGSVAACLVSSGDLELTPFRAYSAIYYEHQGVLIIAQTQLGIACIRKSSVIVSPLGELTSLALRLSPFTQLALLLCSLSISSSFSSPHALPNNLV